MPSPLPAVGRLAASAGRARHPQPAQGRGVPGDRRRDAARSAGHLVRRTRAGRGRRDLRRERADQGTRGGRSHTGLPALADDSGICVDVLGGSPGVFSAYWAGHAKDAAANLRPAARPAVRHPGSASHGAVRLDDRARRAGGRLVGAGRRRALARPARRRAVGRRADSATTRSSSRTVRRDAERTVGEWSAAEKNADSHRARAFAELVGLLAGALAAPRARRAARRRPSRSDPALPNRAIAAPTATVCGKSPDGS